MNYSIPDLNKEEEYNKRDDRYFLHYTEIMVNNVNELMKQGYNQRDACQKVLSQFRAETSAVRKDSGSLN